VLGRRGGDRHDFIVESLHPKEDPVVGVGAAQVDDVDVVLGVLDPWLAWPSTCNQSCRDLFHRLLSEGGWPQWFGVYGSRVCVVASGCCQGPHLIRFGLEDFAALHRAAVGCCRLLRVRVTGLGDGVEVVHGYRESLLVEGETGLVSDHVRGAVDGCRQGA